MSPRVDKEFLPKLHIISHSIARVELRLGDPEAALPCSFTAVPFRISKAPTLIQPSLTIEIVPRTFPILRPFVDSMADSIAGPTARPNQPNSRTFDAPPLIALWHMASLDAPTVAIVWTLAFACAAGVHLPLWVPALVGLVTWAVYIGDRLLDARSALASMQPSRLRHRHRFHWRHRRLFTPLAVSSACAALAIVVIFVPIAARERGAALGMATIAYFSGVHARRNPSSRLGWLPTPSEILGRLPFNEIANELLVAAIFTCGCMIPVWPRAAQLHAPLWPFTLVAAFFMLLAWLNYHAIGRWEADAPASHITPAGLILALAGLALAASLRANHPAAALLIASGAGSATLLAILNRSRSRLTPLALRSSADLALVAPLVLLAPLALLLPSAARSLHP